MVQFIYPFVHPSTCLPIHMHFYIHQAIFIQSLFIYLFKKIYLYSIITHISILPFIHSLIHLSNYSVQPPKTHPLLKNQPIHSPTCVEKSWHPLSFSASCVVNVI